MGSLNKSDEEPKAFSKEEENRQISVADEDEADRHSKSLDWCGWNQTDNDFGLELQEPWAEAVVIGQKAIETRSYDLPPALSGKRIYIIQSPAGQDGISGMGNIVDFRKSEARIIGWCIFSDVKLYKSLQHFVQDEAAHLVSNNSGYGWKEGKTKVIFGWQVKQFGTIDNVTFCTAIRRMRSLFQLN